MQSFTAFFNLCLHPPANDYDVREPRFKGYD
jgi:hypothetical protein